jgi:putative PIG3 family NAD(P)H quinone oxidoreductase
MRFIQIQNPGPHAKLQLTQGPKPQCRSSELLVEVHAAAVNRADLLQRAGKYPPPQGESEVPGLELAGKVVALGSKVMGFELGDKVYGLVGSGAFAQFCAVDASLAHRIPQGWSYTMAAAVPEALTTAYATLYDLGKLKAKQTLLMHGAGSGIASLALQMARLSKAFVITTVGDEEKRIKAQALAHQVIKYKEQDFEDLIEEQSVDLIVDFVGGDYFNRHLHLLKPKGKLVQIACMSGSTVECNLALLMRKRLQITGFVLRPQSLNEKARLWKLAHAHWFGALENGTLKPIVDSVFPIEELEQAQECMRLGQHFGKISIRVR